jgi:hypothetical protein
MILRRYHQVACDGCAAPFCDSSGCLSSHFCEAKVKGRKGMKKLPTFHELREREDATRQALEATNVVLDKILGGSK